MLAVEFMLSLITKPVEELECWFTNKTTELLPAVANPPEYGEALSIDSLGPILTPTLDVD